MHDHRCVCQICTCGHPDHTCPRRKPAPYGKDSASTYHKDYPWKKGEPLEALKKIDSTGFRKVKADPNHFNTTYKDEYIKKAVSSQGDQGPVQSFQKRPTKPFYATTTYKNEYTKKEAERQVFDAPKVQKASGERPRFEGTTTYKNEYVKKPLEKPEPYELKEIKPRAKKPFESGTTYKNNYVPHELPIQEVAQVEKTRISKPAHFEGVTSYKTAYNEKQLPDRAPAAMIEPRKNRAKFEGSTTYKNEYQPKTVARSEKQPEIQTVYKREARFEGNTNYRDEFVPKKIDATKCPIDRLPIVPQVLKQEKNNHIVFNARNKKWE